MAAKTFEPVKLDSAHSGKMTKRDDGQKLNHKEGDIKKQAHSRIENLAMGFRRNSIKGKKNEKQGKAQPSGQWAQNRLWYPGSKTRESLIPRDSRITL